MYENIFGLAERIAFQKWNASYTGTQYWSNVQSSLCIGIWSIHRKWIQMEKQERQPNDTTLLVWLCRAVCSLASICGLIKMECIVNTHHKIRSMNRNGQSFANLLSSNIISILMSAPPRATFRMHSIKILRMGWRKGVSKNEKCI